MGTKFMSALMGSKFLSALMSIKILFSPVISGARHLSGRAVTGTKCMSGRAALPALVVC
jgi:hypothetical protein